MLDPRTGCVITLALLLGCSCLASAHHPQVAAIGFVGSEHQSAARLSVLSLGRGTLPEGQKELYLHVRLGLEHVGTHGRLGIRAHEQRLANGYGQPLAPRYFGGREATIDLAPGERGQLDLFFPSTAHVDTFVLSWHVQAPSGPVAGQVPLEVLDVMDPAGHAFVVPAAPTPGLAEVRIADAWLWPDPSWAWWHDSDFPSGKYLVGEDRTTGQLVVTRGAEAWDLAHPPLEPAYAPWHDGFTPFPPSGPVYGAPGRGPNPRATTSGWRRRAVFRAPPTNASSATESPTLPSTSEAPAGEAAQDEAPRSGASSVGQSWRSRR